MVNLLAVPNFLYNTWFLAGAAGVIILLGILFFLWLFLRGGKKSKQIQIEPAALQGGNPATACEPLVKAINKLGKKQRNVLLTCGERETLPIVIAIHTATGLAQSKRCLLVDMDLNNNGVARAFGMDKLENVDPHKAVPSEMGNLWIWPAQHFQQVKTLNLPMLFEKAEERFDKVIVNAPGILSSPDRKHLMTVCDAVIVFYRNEAEKNKLDYLTDGCDVVPVAEVAMNADPALLVGQKADPKAAASDLQQEVNPDQSLPQVDQINLQESESPVKQGGDPSASQPAPPDDEIGMLQDENFGEDIDTRIFEDMDDDFLGLDEEPQKE